jgi:hypothetical protein
VKLIASTNIRIRIRLGLVRSGPVRYGKATRIRVKLIVSTNIRIRIRYGQVRSG